MSEEQQADNRRRILVVGATGLIGGKTIEIGNEHPEFRMLALSRREFEIPHGVKLEVLVADPANWREAVTQMGPDALICTIGTTWRKSGKDEDAFRAVDHDLVMEIAHGAKQGEVHNFVLVSSAGADPRSKNFYLRTKGEVEAEVQKLRLPRLDILRPGLLRGNRKRDMRPLELLGMLASPLVNLLLQGPRRKYRAIPAQIVAEAALQLASEKAGGRFTHDHDAIRLAAKRFNY